jgi:hypothetical protein
MRKTGKRWNAAGRSILFCCCALLLSSGAWAKEEEYKLDLSEVEKKPYHLGGFAEARPVLNVVDKSAALYKTNFYNYSVGATTPEYNNRLQLEGSYESKLADGGIVRFFFRANEDLNNTYQGWYSNGRLYEGFMSFKPTDTYHLDIGKRTFKWGKGYAWNPVAFIDRPKDPNDPDLALEGFWTLSGDYTKSFSGPLKTLSFTPVFLPVVDPMNTDFAQSPANPNQAPSTIPSNANVAAKLYLLLYDTDVDFIFFTGGSKTTRYGMDFSRNLSTNFEIHGELAFIEDFAKRVVGSNGNISTQTYDAWSYLLGIRYLTEKSTTYILEYFYNGAGYTGAQMDDFYSFVNKGYDLYLNTRNSSQINNAANLAQGGYGRNTPQREYLYLRVSQLEPFDILYFTPAITMIMNARDGSFSVTPELLYTGITNLELRLKTFFIVGGRNTEFGEKQYDYRIEFRMRYYF